MRETLNPVEQEAIWLRCFERLPVDEATPHPRPDARVRRAQRAAQSARGRSFRRAFAERHAEEKVVSGRDRAHEEFVARRAAARGREPAGRRGAACSPALEQRDRRDARDRPRRPVPARPSRTPSSLPAFAAVVLAAAGLAWSSESHRRRPPTTRRAPRPRGRPRRTPAGDACGRGGRDGRWGWSRASRRSRARGRRAASPRRPAGSRPRAAARRARIPRGRGRARSRLLLRMPVGERAPKLLARALRGRCGRRTHASDRGCASPRRPAGARNSAARSLPAQRD